MNSFKFPLCYVPAKILGSLKRTHEEDDDFGSMQVATAQNGWIKSNVIEDVNSFLGRKKH